MSKTTTIIAGLAGCAIVAFVVVQQLRVSKLEANVAALAKGEAIDDEPDEGGTVADRSRASSSSSRPRTVRVISEENKRLTLRVAALEKTVARFLGLMATGGLAGSKSNSGGEANGPATGPDGKDVTSLREDVDALLTGEALNTTAGAKRLEDMVSKAAEKAQAARRKKWRAIGDQAAAARIKDFAAKARLNPTQTAQLTAITTAGRNERRALFDAVRSGDKTFKEARPQAKAMRKATHTKLGQVLTPDQLKAYDKDVGSGRGRRR